MITQDEYNEWFKRMLSKHPINHKYSLSSEENEDSIYLKVVISHPIDREKDISISTYGKEMTLSIWMHHEHHDSSGDDNHEKEFINLFKYIDDIIGDKVLFSVGYRNDKVAYGTVSYKIDDLLDKSVDRIEIKSWSGMHDQTTENNA